MGRGGGADRRLSQRVPLAAGAQHEEDRVHRRPVRHARIVAPQRMLWPRRQQPLHLGPQRIRQTPAIISDTPFRRPPNNTLQHHPEMGLSRHRTYWDRHLAGSAGSLSGGAPAHDRRPRARHHSTPLCRRSAASSVSSSHRWRNSRSKRSAAVCTWDSVHQPNNLALPVRPFLPSRPEPAGAWLAVCTAVPWRADPWRLSRSLCADALSSGPFRPLVLERRRRARSGPGDQAEIVVRLPSSRRALRRPRDHTPRSRGFLRLRLLSVALRHAWVCRSRPAESPSALRLWQIFQPGVRLRRRRLRAYRSHCFALPSVRRIGPMPAIAGERAECFSRGEHAEEPHDKSLVPLAGPHSEVGSGAPAAKRARDGSVWPASPAPFPRPAPRRAACSPVPAGGARPGPPPARNRTVLARHGDRPELVAARRLRQARACRQLGDAAGAHTPGTRHGDPDHP